MRPSSTNPLATRIGYYRDRTTLNYGSFSYLGFCSAWVRVVGRIRDKLEGRGGIIFM